MNGAWLYPKFGIYSGMTCQDDAIKKALAGAQEVDTLRGKFAPLLKAGWSDGNDHASLSVQNRPYVGVQVRLQDGVFSVYTSPGGQTCILKTVEEVIAYGESLRKAFAEKRAS